MGFGAIVTHGDDKALLPGELLQWLVEVRVEMELSKPTRFAMRFEDDICEGATAFEEAPELEPNTKIGLFVNAGDSLQCLVFGPVTERKSSAVVGGAGSWVEIHGEDRRIEMARVGIESSWTGRASDAAAAILGGYGFTPDTQETLIEYAEDRGKLAQRGTDLTFLEEIARRNNMELWIEYAAQLEPLSNSIALEETAKLRTSPHRSQSAALDAVPEVAVLVPAGDDARAHVLKVNPPREDCPTVNKFEARIDFEKPAAAEGFAATDTEDEATVRQLVEQTSTPTDVDPVSIQGVERKLIVPPAPTPEEASLAREALVYEQSWFVEVDTSSSLEQLGFVAIPHQIVTVTHAGERLSGNYQVMSATHVVTATDHLMDFKLRANGLGAVS